MNIQQAFTEVYPTKQFNYTTEVTFSGKFKPYNARIRLRNNHLHFSVSNEWKTVDEDITKGLVQSLLLRLFGGKQATLNIQLYNSFLKKLPSVTERKQSEPMLTESFQRVNEQYFFSTMDQPTLVWGQKSTRTLAHYNLHIDTITMSTIFTDAPIHLRDYVMYHEMLHKKHQFSGSARRQFHTPAFRADERMFKNAEQCEKELNAFIRPRQRKRWSGWF